VGVEVEAVVEGTKDRDEFATSHSFAFEEEDGPVAALPGAVFPDAEVPGLLDRE